MKRSWKSSIFSEIFPFFPEIFPKFSASNWKVEFEFLTTEFEFFRVFAKNLSNEFESSNLDKFSSEYRVYSNSIASLQKSEPDTGKSLLTQGSGTRIFSLEVTVFIRLNLYLTANAIFRKSQVKIVEDQPTFRLINFWRVSVIPA